MADRTRKDPVADRPWMLSAVIMVKRKIGDDMQNAGDAKTIGQSRRNRQPAVDAHGHTNIELSTANTRCHASDWHIPPETMFDCRFLMNSAWETKRCSERSGNSDPAAAARLTFSEPGRDSAPIQESDARARSWRIGPEAKPDREQQPLHPEWGPESPPLPARRRTPGAAMPVAGPETRRRFWTIPEMSG